MFSTSYYSIFSSDINFLVEIFLPVIVPFLVVIFINFWMVIFATCYFRFAISFLVVKVINRGRQTNPSVLKQAMFLLVIKCNKSCGALFVDISRLRRENICLKERVNELKEDRKRLKMKYKKVKRKRKGFPTRG